MRVSLVSSHPPSLLVFFETSMSSLCLLMMMMMMMMMMTSSSMGYEIGCIYPVGMPKSPIQAQDEMITFLSASTQVDQVETPIAVHNALLSALCGSQCLAMHDSKVLSPLTLQRPRLVAPAEFGHNAYSIAMCSLQCHVSLVRPERMQPLLNRWGLDSVITERMHPKLAHILDEAEEEGSWGTSYLLKIATLVKELDYHPYIMGQLAVLEIYDEYVYDDGWNTRGELTFDRRTKQVVNCTANCMKYSDISGYFPRNHPQHQDNDTEETKYIVEGNNMYWQPLLEDDGRGYFSRQQHVVPHIRYAKSFTGANVHNRTAPPPNYDYHKESLQVIEEMRQTADSPDRRWKVRVFDNKFLVRGVFQSETQRQFASQHSYQKHLLFVLGTSMAEDDAVLTSWSEKVRHDLVRPTTVIQRWGDDIITTYNGDPMSTSAMEIAARDFQAFVRVMPHSEYVSGSACLCTAYREYADLYHERMYGKTLQDIQYGAGGGGAAAGEGFALNCNGDLDDIGIPRHACSASESFVLSDMSHLEEVCGQSRLWGGMHFTKSVPAGHELCQGLGEIAMDLVEQIMAGSDFNSKEYLAGDDDDSSSSSLPLCTNPELAVSRFVNGDGTDSTLEEGLAAASSGILMMGHSTAIMTAVVFMAVVAGW